MPTEMHFHPTHLLHRLFDAGTLTGQSDADLVDRYKAPRDPGAFAALVDRHGAMVLAVCRGVAGSGGDNAFQAIWLIFLHRIGTFPVAGSLRGWLHRVARRVARQAKTANHRAVAGAS